MMASLLLTAPRLLFALGILGVAAGHAAAQSEQGEYRLKAVFLYQFPQFVEWPEPAWRDAKAVQLCVARPNPFGEELERLVRGDSLRGRPLAVRTVASPGELEGCHLLFVGAKAPNADAMLKVSAQRAILTVGETDAFLSSGGIVTLKVINNLVRFEVDAGAAQRAGLRMSSQLLGLANDVRGVSP
jgi:hypothetical protein